MKKDVHPQNYRPVLFVDVSNDEEFIIASTVETSETAVAKKDGKEYPVYKVEISSASHPFYTGKEKVLDTAGRVEKFKARQKAAKPAPAKKKKKVEERSESSEKGEESSAADKK